MSIHCSVLYVANAQSYSSHNKTTPLDCWREVEEFKQSVAVLEKVCFMDAFSLLLTNCVSPALYRLTTVM